MKRIIVIVVVILALLPTIFVGSAVIYNAQATIKNEKQDALSSTVHIMIFHLNSYYQHLISDIQLKAERPALKTALEPSEAVKRFDESVQQAEVREIVLESIGFPVIGGAVIDLTGKVMMSSQPEEAGLMLNRTELYKSIVGGKDSYVGWVTAGNTADTFEIAVPVKNDQNKIIGILRQDVDLNIIREYLGSIGGGSAKYAFLIRRSGSVFYDMSGESPAFLYQDYRSSNSLERLVSDFKNDQMDNRRGIIEFEVKGVEFMGAYEEVESIDCIAVVAVDKEEMYGNVLSPGGIFMAAVLFFIIIITACGYFISTQYRKPIKMMNETLMRILDGDLTARSRLPVGSEYGELCGNINMLADNYQKNEKELRLSSRSDNLTHLPNSNAIYELLDTLLHKHPNQALLLLDLEGFHGFNDNLGYDFGDKILIEVADILRKLPQHVCYPSRLGGAEFLIFVTNWTAPKYPEMIAEKIIREIDGIRFIDEVHVDINANIGIAYSNNERTDKKKLIKYSNIAMHKARVSGKNSYEIYYPFM